MESAEVKKLAIESGADDCGIAEVSRFNEAPKGFHPQDIYPSTKSVIVFIKSMPHEIITCPNPVPYTGAAFLIFQEIDRIGLELTRRLADKQICAVPVPCDTPYLHWDAENLHGQGILSMRHAGFLAGLGYLGKNTLLINPKYGNMVYIGAVLADINLASNPVLSHNCPQECRLCLDACPANALTGQTVIQKLCRPKSMYTNARGFTLYDCCRCRQICPRRTGYKES